MINQWPKELTHHALHQVMASVINADAGWCRPVAGVVLPYCSKTVRCIQLIIR
jgi:hypothetical protein